MYGLGLLEVHDALRWLSTVTSYPISSNFSKEAVAATVGQLTHTVPQDLPQGHTTEYAILADPENMEAMATAEVLGTFLKGLIPERGQSPRIFTADSNVSRTSPRLTSNRVSVIPTSIPSYLQKRTSQPYWFSILYDASTTSSCNDVAIAE